MGRDKKKEMKTKYKEAFKIHPPTSKHCLRKYLSQELYRHPLGTLWVIQVLTTNLIPLPPPTQHTFKVEMVKLPTAFSL